MRVSTAGRYALRAMLDLAHYGQEYPTLRQEIAGRQDISSEYIAQLFRQLNHAGLVRSVMGPGGGYLLARKPGEINVAEIMRAVEGPFAVVFCVRQPESTDQTQPAKECLRIEHCAAHILWSRLTQVIENYLASVTLQDLSYLASQLDPAGEAGCSDPITALLQPFPEPAVASCPFDFAI